MDGGLPEEVELRWLACLGWPDLVRAAQVCSRWHRLGTPFFSLFLVAFVFSRPPRGGACSQRRGSVGECLCARVRRHRSRCCALHNFRSSGTRPAEPSVARVLCASCATRACRVVSCCVVSCHPPPRQALDRLWGADESTSIEYGEWTSTFLLDTRLYQPSRTVR
jgi:hypothetical protein